MKEALEGDLPNGTGGRHDESVYHAWFGAVAVTEFALFSGGSDRTNVVAEIAMRKVCGMG